MTRTIDLIKEIMAGKMLYPVLHEDRKEQNLYGLSNHFKHYTSLESFLGCYLDWKVYNPIIKFDDLPVGTRFKFHEDTPVTTKLSITDGKNTWYGYKDNSIVYLELGNPVIIKV